VDDFDVLERTLIELRVTAAMSTLVPNRSVAGSGDDQGSQPLRAEEGLRKNIYDDARRV
jgi:hypothetical protein